MGRVRRTLEERVEDCFRTGPLGRPAARAVRAARKTHPDELVRWWDAIVARLDAESDTGCLGHIDELAAWVLFRGGDAVIARAVDLGRSNPRAAALVGEVVPLIPVYTAEDAETLAGYVRLLELFGIDFVTEVQFRFWHEDSRWDSWAGDVFFHLVDSVPEVAWPAVLRLLELAPPDLVSLVGVFYLEDLLVDHGSAMVERFERQAESDPKFRDAMRDVWSYPEIPGEVKRRVEHALGYELK